MPARIGSPGSRACTSTATASRRSWPSRRRRPVTTSSPTVISDPTRPSRARALLLPADRTETGDALLTRAKDVLFALLFGDAATGTRWTACSRSS